MAVDVTASALPVLVTMGINSSSSRAVSSEFNGPQPAPAKGSGPGSAIPLPLIERSDTFGSY